MNFEKTVNAMPFEKAAGENWYLSMKPVSPKQTLSVQFEDGKSYKFLATGNVNVGDPVIIGYGGSSSYKMGNVDGIEKGVNIKRDYALAPLFTFTTNPDKSVINQNAKAMKWLENIDDVAQCFGEDCEYTEEAFQVVDYLVGAVLNAITVVAFPSLSSEDTVKKAKSFLAEEKNIPSLVFSREFTDKYYGCFFDVLRLAETAEVAFTGFYPGWKEDLLNSGFMQPDVLDELDIEVDRNDNETAYYMYFEDGSSELEDYFRNNKEFRNFTNELVMRSALSILIRGGFVNLLKAALSVEMPIKDFYVKLKDFAEEIGSSKCLEVLSQIDYVNKVF